MELNNIKPSDNWGTTASNINSNFQKTSVEVEKIRYLTEKGKGLYKTAEALRVAIPTPRDGDWAIVGTTVPGPLWSAAGGVWSETGESGGVGNVELAGYATTEDLNTVKKTADAAKEESATAKKAVDGAVQSAADATKAAAGAVDAASTATTAAGEAATVADTAKKSADASVTVAGEAKKTADAVSTAFGALSGTVQKTISLINVNELCEDISYTLATALVAISDKETAGDITYKKKGLVITYRADEGFETKQFAGTLESWSDEGMWKDFGGGGSGSGAGNVFNVTELVPLESGYYTLATAIIAIPEEFRRKGLVVTFESAQGKWLSYQFIGTSLESFTAVASWGEFGGAGTVKQITLNGEKQTPDEQGNVTLSVDEIQVDETLTATGTNPVQGKVIQAAIERIEAGAALLLNTLGEGDDKAYSLSLLDKNGEVMSTTEAFSGGGGGGGSVATTKIVLTRITDNLTVKAGEEVKLQFMYDQIDTTSGSSTGNPAQAVITISRGATSNTINQTLSAGSTTTLDVSKYIGVGSNTIRVRVTVGEGAEQQVSSIAWSVNAVELKLSSSFNIATVINQGDLVSVPFALQGGGSKTLRLYVDGVDSEDRTIGTSSSNGSFLVATSNMSHGAHSVQLVAELEMSDGKKILSNSIYFDIAVRAGGDSPIIATRFDYPDGSVIGIGLRPYVSVRQYDEYTISYAAYHPKEVPTLVTIKESGVEVSSVRVSFIANSIKMRALNGGESDCSILCGVTSYAYKLMISPSDLHLYEPVDGMTLKLSAMGRSNSDVNREEWKYQSVSTKLEGFKFGGDGWIDNALRLNGSARAVVQLMPLHTPEQNVTNAFTFSIRMRVTDSVNDESEVVRCMDNGIGFVITTQEARMVTNGNSTVAMKFAPGEIYTIGFVSHPQSTVDSTEDAKLNDSMVFLYINGIMSGGVQRSKSDGIYQDNPQFITIGSDECSIDVYGMRSYSVALTDAQMLDAHIIDLSTVDELIDTYNKNNVLDGNGKITVDSLPVDIPYMVVTGVQPNGIPTLIHAAIMNNKKTKFNVDQILFVWKSKAFQNFLCIGGCISLQGTSSLAYPIKNYRFYFKDSNKVPGKMYLGCDTQGVGGVLQEKPVYSLTMKEQGIGKISVPVDCFCAKADYAESSSSHNTGMARLVNDVLGGCDLLVPPQRYVDKSKYEYDVRTTVDGHPVMLFYRNTVNDTPVFAGKFNLNNDKSTEGVFGFKGIPGYHDADWVQEKFGGKNPTECWEFLNNDYPMGMFLDDDFETKDEEGVPNWLKVFEARFPDDDDINAEYEAGTRKPENLMRLVKWVKSTKGNGAKFKAELSDYFDVEFLCAYYMFTEMMGCVDQRVKNMMFGFWYDPAVGKLLCYPIFYDCDTILGVRNDGRLKYPPFIDHNSIDPELTTSQKTVYAYAGHDSVLWQNLREQCKDELAAVYKKMRANMTNDTIFNMFDKEQSAKFCERVYNLDALYKYVSPKTKGVDVINNGQVTTLTYSYMEAMQGSRMSHRHWWVNNRMSLFDARYMTGQYLSTDLTFKGNSAAGAVIKATPIRDFYFAFSREGSVMTHAAVVAEQEWSYTYNNMANIGTIFHFYGGEYVRKLDLSLWGGFADINLPYMPKLQELTLGVAGHEYQLSELAIGTKIPMMTKLVMRNYIKIPSVDLSRCAHLVSFDGRGCSALSVANFAEGAPLNSIYYPGNYKVLKLLSLPNITRGGIAFEQQQSVTSMWIENCARLDAMEMFDEFLSMGNSSLRYVRITGVSLTGDGADLQRWKNSGIGGMDSSGNNTSTCRLAGSYQLTKYLEESVYNELNAAYPELNIKQPAYTCMEFDESVSDPANISNLDNKTGYKFGNDYKPSAHISKILGMRHRVLGKKTATGVVTICNLHDQNSNYFADGYSPEESTPAMLDGSQGDIYVYEPRYWYKGVNDIVGRKKYAYFSTYYDVPTPTNGVKLTYRDLTVTRGVAAMQSTDYTTLQAATAAAGGYSCVSVPLSSYKRVRFPSVASAAYGALLLDAQDRILSRIKTLGSWGCIDGMYAFTDIPQSATKLVFTIKDDAAFDFVFLTNSMDIADIEPGWVEHQECLGGTYVGYEIDGVIRSINNAVPTFDKTHDYYKAAIGLLGKGFKIMDYELIKDVNNLVLAKYGNKDSQKVFGMANRIEATSSIGNGITTSLGMNDTYRDLNSNFPAFKGVKVNHTNILGYDAFIDSQIEFIGDLTVNEEKIDYKWKVTRPDGSIEKIQGPLTPGGYVSSLYFQKYMDTIPVTLLGSTTTYYSDRYKTSVYGDKNCIFPCRYSSPYGDLTEVPETGLFGFVLTYSKKYHSSDLYVRYSCCRLSFRGTILKQHNPSLFKLIESVS